MSKVVLPEVDFVRTDPTVITQSVISSYEKISGRTLSEADPVRLFLLSLSSVIVEQSVALNDAAKQNLLYYSRNEVLDHKGYAWTTPRLGNDFASVMVKFHLSTIFTSARIIPVGTELTDKGDIIFITAQDLVIAPGMESGEVRAVCTTPGIMGNGFEIGLIDTMIKPLPYVSKVENITISDSGTERELDAEYRERIRNAPEKLSTAGPEGAYEYFAYTASAAISDVDVSTPLPGEVAVKILSKNGNLPSEEIINKVKEVLSDKKVRPLTDKVTVGPPVVVNYALDVKYFVDSQSTDKSLIKENIEAAINSYIIWQKSKIGRDINPSKLISDCVRAGAKRVEVVSPTFTVIQKGEVAHELSTNIVFGGDEDG